MADVAADRHPAAAEQEEARPPSSSAAAAEEEDEEEEEEGDVCRICRNPGDDEHPLRYPCACSGSIKFVHQECLLQWLDHSNSRQCEVCKHAFSFSPVYADNAPSRLPFQELIVGVGMKACHVLQFVLRLAFVLSVWLMIIPFITYWIWRLTFVRSLGEAQRLFLSHISAQLILSDCLHGFLLSAIIVLIFLGATSLRDYIRHLRELGGHDAERDDGGRERHGARAVRRLPGPNNRVPAADGNIDELAEAQGLGAGELLRRNAENVAARLERLEAQVEQMLDGLDDADGAEDVPFDELVGMQGPVFHLVENAITFDTAVLFKTTIASCGANLEAISTSSPMLAKMMPFTETAISLANDTLKSALNAVKNLSSDSHNEGVIGHVIEVVTQSLKINATGLTVMQATGKSSLIKGTTIGSSYLSDLTTLAVGYMFIFCLVFLYIGSLALLRYARGERFTIGRLYGIATILEAIPSLCRQFFAGMKHLMTMVKVAFLLVIELGVFPLMCGWWLDVLRNGVLYFLRDPADPNYNPFRDLIDDPVHKHARRVLLSVAVYGSLIVMLVFLPVKLAMRVAPTIFPLDITIFDPFTEIPVDVLLFQICIPFAIEHFKPRATIKALLHHWFAAVGWALGLTDFLLPRQEENGGQENWNGRADNNNVRGNANDGNEVAEESDVDDQGDSEYGFVLRIVLLLVMAWMTLLMFNAGMIVIPISLGRLVFEAIPRLPITHGIKCNDLFSFSIGCYIIWSAAAGTRYAIDYIRSRRLAFLVQQICKWCSIVVKSSALLSIWIFVIPVLIGLLFELLVIVPMRVPIDESPVFLLYQDWALGLIFLKIWTRLVMLDQMAPLVDESWRMKFERVREDGFSRLRGLWVLHEIIMPIVTKLLTALCVPYVLARGVFPALGYPLIVNSAVYRFAWLGCLIFSALFFCGKRFHVWFTNLHNSIRDDRYLIGRRLHNFGEDSPRSSETGAAPVSDDEEENEQALIPRDQEGESDIRHLVIGKIKECCTTKSKGKTAQEKDARQNTRVTGCRKLRDTEFFTRQDPYVCIEYATTKVRTRTCTDGGRNPTFDEKFQIPLVEGLRELSVAVWNSNTLSHDDFIGSGRVQLQKVLTRGYDDSSWSLQTRHMRSAGEVTLIMHFDVSAVTSYSTYSVPPVPVPAMPYAAPPPSYAPAPAGYPAVPPYQAYPTSHAPAPYAAPAYGYPPLQVREAEKAAYPPTTYPPQPYPPQPQGQPYPPQPQGQPYPPQPHGQPYPPQPKEQTYPPQPQGQPYPPQPYGQPYPPPPEGQSTYPPAPYPATYPPAPY
uniref:RING-type E3 ubiquitin transferase n=1 Tax=Leersia perrieri TaxID=77586 RepID=A0A0D9WSF8_9ORYZ